MLEKIFFLDYKMIDDSNLSKIDNSILRVLKRYYLNIWDYENNKLTEAMFNRLGWNNRYKDTIFSFYRSICGIVECFSKIDEYKILLDGGAILIFYYDNNSLKYEINENKSDKYQYNKSLLYKKATEDNQSLNIVMKHIFEDTLIFNELKDTAELTDSLCNFTSHPGYPFNQAKGFLKDVADSLNLMIDKIQECIDENVDLVYGTKHDEIVKLEKLKEWQTWFINNQSSYCLDGFYKIVQNNRLEGVKLFNGQSLNNPLPTNREEIRQYLCNMNELLYERGKTMNKAFH